MASNKIEWQTFCKTIQDANLHLLESGKFSDVIFVVGSEKTEIPAHKLILKTRSPVFETMFERWETGDNVKVEIPEVDRNSFIVFLDFLYTNSVVSITGKVTAEVMYLAHKYSVPELALKCSSRLTKSIVVKSAIELNQIASKLQQENLRKQTEEFILRNGKAVFVDCGFLEIHEDTLCAFLKNDNLRVDELTVFRAVMRWADNKCKLSKLKSSAENQRAVLKDLLPLIRFPLMSSKEFTDEVVRKNKGILTENETIALYIHFNSGLAPSLPFATKKRAEGIVFNVDLFKLSESATTVQPMTTDKSKLPTLCRSQAVNGITGTCETTIWIRPDRDIRIQAVELHRDSRCEHPSTNKPLIRSLIEALEEDTERFRSSCFGRLVGSTYYEDIKTCIEISVLGPKGVATKPPDQVEQVKDITRIEFENGVHVGKSNAFSLKITVTGSNVAGSSRPIQLDCPSEPVHSTSKKVNCESDVVSFMFSSPKSNCCIVQNPQRQNQNASCVCISAGHIKAVHFTV